MKIKELELTNFGIISDETLHFDSGIHLFFSEGNGEGKSTFLKALSLALFNQVPGKMSDYIKWGESSAHVGVFFSHRGQDFETRLDISSKLNSRFLKNHTTGEEWNSTSAVVEKLNEILDTKRAIASTTSFEHEIDLITTSPSERREYLKKVYDLDFKEEIKSIEERVQTSEREKITQFSKIEALKAQTFETKPLARPPLSESKLEDKKEEISSLKETLSEVESELTLKIHQKDELSKKLDNVASISNSYDKALKDLENKRVRLTSLEETLSEAEDQDVENVLSKFTTRSMEVSSSIKDEEVLVEELSRGVEELNNALQVLGYSEDNKTSLQSLYDRLGANIELIDKQTSQLQSGECPVCGQSVSEHSLADRGKEKEELQSQLQEAKRNLDSVIEIEHRHKDLSNELVSKNKRLDQSENNLTHLKKQLESIALEKEEAAFSFKEQKASRVREIQDSIHDVSSAISSLETEADRLSREVVENSSLEEDISSINISINSLKEKVSNIKVEIAEKESLVSETEKVLNNNELIRKMNEESLRKKNERDLIISDLEKQFETVSEHLESLQLARKILSRDFPAFVLSRLIQNVEAFANEFLSSVYPKYTLSFKESKNSLSVEYGPTNTDVKLASGFEKQVFSFAYKYAIGRLQEYGILMLDEVDSAASESNSKKFFQTIAMMEEFFPQIFIITHKKDTVELLEKDYNANVISISEGKIAS